MPSWRVFHELTQIIWNGWFWFFMIFKHQKSFIQFGIILRVSCFIHRTQKFHVLARYIRIIRLCEFKKNYTLNSASVSQIGQMSAKNRKTWRWQNARKCVVVIAVGFMAPLGNHWKMNYCKKKSNSNQLRQVIGDIPFGCCDIAFRCFQNFSSRIEPLIFFFGRFRLRLSLPFIFLAVASGTISKMTYKLVRETSFSECVNNWQDPEAKCIQVINN